jgi:uncharacterized protein YndB with AHSA1/START domain
VIDLDVQHEISAVRRTVGDRTLEVGEARTVTLSRSYDGTVEDLWDACTNPERIPRWFLPVTGDLRVGGRYQLEGNAGGEVLTCDPPRSFTATWEMGEGISWIEVTVAPDGEGRARMELTHIAPVDAHWGEFGPGAVGMGWDLGLTIGLVTHLATGGTVDPAEAAAWTGSADGLAFQRASSAAWLAADLASGTPAEQARAAAERCLAAYTGPG